MVEGEEAKWKLIHRLKVYSAKISYLEVYNETVRDFLTTERRETPPPFRV